MLPDEDPPADPLVGAVFRGDLEDCLSPRPTTCCLATTGARDAPVEAVDLSSVGFLLPVTEDIFDDDAEGYGACRAVFSLPEAVTGGRWADRSCSLGEGGRWDEGGAIDGERSLDIRCCCCWCGR